MASLQLAIECILNGLLTNDKRTYILHEKFKMATFQQKKERMAYLQRNSCCELRVSVRLFFGASQNAISASSGYLCEFFGTFPSPIFGSCIYLCGIFGTSRSHIFNRRRAISFGFDHEKCKGELASATAMRADISELSCR